MNSISIEPFARELGFALVGACEARPSAHADMVRQWLAAGRHGEMDYLARNLEIRLDPARLLDGARSVIAVADAYPSGRSPTPYTPPPLHPTPVGRVARYAWGDDYHKVLKKRLHALADRLREIHPDAEFRCVVDTAPALEREHATRAGLGWTGKNTMLIHPRHGSYFLLGLIVTTIPCSKFKVQSSKSSWHGSDNLKPETWNLKLQTDHCGTCTRCIDACPTGCIENPDDTGRRSLDATRCISYLTLEHRSLIDPLLHEAMGDWIAGCDVCQQVCPYNGDKAIPLPIHPRYAPRSELADGLSLLDVLQWTAEDRQAAFTGSALKRIKLDMLRRNAVIAAGNLLKKLRPGRFSGLDQPEPKALHHRIRAIAASPAEPDLVRATAKQVLSRLDALVPPPGAAPPQPASAPEPADPA